MKTAINQSTIKLADEQLPKENDGNISYHRTHRPPRVLFARAGLLDAGLLMTLDCHCLKYFSIGTDYLAEMGSQNYDVAKIQTVTTRCRAEGCEYDAVIIAPDFPGLHEASPESIQALCPGSALLVYCQCDASNPLDGFLEEYEMKSNLTARGFAAFTAEDVSFGEYDIVFECALRQAYGPSGSERLVRKPGERCGMDVWCDAVDAIGKRPRVTSWD